MAADSQDLSYAELLGLLAGDPRLRARLEAGERLRVATPFVYPRRQTPVVANLSLLVESDATSSEGDAATPTAAADQEGIAATARIRISDAGDLIRSLGDLGLELDLDMILSKTVVHAVRQVQDADVANGEVYLDCTVDKIAGGLWRFLQMVVEIIGLRHGKYKDAMVQLERRQDADPGMTGWHPR